VTGRARKAAVRARSDALIHQTRPSARTVVLVLPDGVWIAVHVLCESSLPAPSAGALAEAAHRRRRRGQHGPQDSYRTLPPSPGDH
jgi:hypothetical protein